MTPVQDIVNIFGFRKLQSPFLTLARQSDLDQETAFTICQMIDMVGYDLVDKWDWDWLKGDNLDYCALIKRPILDKAWKKLFAKDWLNLQTTNDDDKRISTIAPLEGMTNLRTLVLQNNLIEDLRPLSGMLQLKDLNL